MLIGHLDVSICHTVELGSGLLHLRFFFLTTVYVLFLDVGDGLGEGYGMLGQAGNGKLRVSVGQSKLAAKVAKK